MPIMRSFIRLELNILESIKKLLGEEFHRDISLDSFITLLIQKNAPDVRVRE